MHKYNIKYFYNSSHYINVLKLYDFSVNNTIIIWPILKYPNTKTQQYIK